MKYKNYVHFDNRIKLEVAEEYVKNINKHQYLPFITYEKDKNKWDDDHNKINETRTISISSIKDNYVYQHFNEEISLKYEDYIKDTKLKDCVCAYRTNQHKSNITTFNEVYEFLSSKNNIRLFIGDISKYFDSLDHKILKNNFKEVLKVKELDENIYSMLKSLEKASYISIDDIIKFLNKKGIYIKTSKDKYKEICSFCNEHNLNTIVKQEWFKELKKDYLKPSKEELKNKSIGIVQGSPISGTLSNIYAINIDKEIIKLLDKYDYIYRRYCDDFIIAINDISDKEYDEIINKVKTIINDSKLELKDSKIQKINYINKHVENLSNSNKQYIQFLGFILKDNDEVDLRQSTLDKQRNKILRSSRNFEEYYSKSKNKDKKEEEFKRSNYDKLKDVRVKNYKLHTFGSYVSLSYRIIKSNDIKKTKKDLVEFINKHIGG